jgi:maltose/moltooligosaccharide transporter
MNLLPMKAESHNTFSVGTLTYDKRGLWIVFFWLMWNDFSITLLEQVTTLTSILMRDRGASYTLLAAFGTVGTILGIWINPVFSTWSDRLRTPFGRRRPILFIAVPLFAVSLCFIPFMPDLHRFLMRIGPTGELLGRLPGNGEVIFIGIAGIINGLFNGVVLAIFSYFYWDVVPEVVLGRFNSLAKIVTVAAGVIWNFFIVGLAEHHTKAVYIGVSVFCLSIYLLSIWRVKEGQYPPPESRTKGNPFEPILVYFRDCFSKSYFLWIFLGSTLVQLGNLGNNFQLFYLRYDLGLDLTATGWITGVGLTATTIFGVTLGYSAGSLIDRLKPIRVIPVTLFLWSLIVLVSYFVVHDKVSAAIMAAAVNINLFVFSVAVGAVTVELFPREKIGQFCSAQVLFISTIIMILNPLVISPLFDWLKFNRAAYLWSSACYFLSALVAVKVYRNWKRTQAGLADPNILALFGKT